MALTPQKFKDASPHREDDLLIVEEITVDVEDDTVLAEEYKGHPHLLEFDTAETTPWLNIDEVVRLRNYLNSWIQYASSNDPTF